MAGNCFFITGGRTRSSTHWHGRLLRNARQGEGRSGQVGGSARLFLLPGVEHCGSGGGEGPDAVGSEHGLPAPEVDAEHDVLAALAQWVETGTAPEKLIATKYQGDDPTKPIVMQRPACAYPKMARYTGSGDTNAAASFVCE